MSPDTVAQAPDHLPCPAESGEKESVTGLQDGAVKFDILLKKIPFPPHKLRLKKFGMKIILSRIVFHIKGSSFSDQPAYLIHP